MNRANLFGDFKGAYAPHEFQRREVFGRGLFRQTGHRILKHPAVVFIDAETLTGSLL